ncbi:MAG: preprotein translocase subunit SecE [Sphingomonadales bacterium]|nr:MAG: preprotein translocase subunit SecE [Sphingomonadales bacterium]TNF05547.1 MAG: preprotein translocase subunit SecE [Sphingomonadales bacterium]
MEVCCSAVCAVLQYGLKSVAKTSPGEFVRQVRQEASKIVWPSGRETMVTAVMVIIMTTLLGLFFFGTDTFFGWVVSMLLSLATGK